jgi:tetratricopeptide (TPR) repeat protein
VTIGLALALLLVAQERPPVGPCGVAEATLPDADQARTCDRAIATASGTAKARLLFERGYIHNEKGDTFAALTDLDASVATDPDNTETLQERAYTNNELGNYAEALADLDKAATLGVSTARLFNERAMSRLKLGNVAGAIADRDRIVALTPGDGDAYNARAGDLLWVGRFDDARADIARALAIAETAKDQGAKASAETHLRRLASMTEGPEPNPGAVCQAVQGSGDFSRKGLIATCTAAYLAASSPKAKAELLTMRSSAWLFANDDAQATTDLQMAAALDPRNPDWHANLGFAYVRSAHSWAAEREFDRSLAIRESWAALGGRARARYNLHKVNEAFADAKKSFEIRPNEIALIVLGDLFDDKHEPKGARLYWMAAYHMGVRGDDLLDRLKKIGVTDPAKEPSAK